jgi:hypothetical protein
MNGKQQANQAFKQFQKSPGYKFQLDQMNKASNAAASAGGRYSSGSQMIELMKLGGNLANQEYGNYTQNLTSLANMGLGMDGRTQSAAAGLGTQLGQNAITAGQAAASGQINQANIMSNMIGQGMQLYGMQQGGYFGQPQQAAVNTGAGDGYAPYSMPQMPAYELSY